MPPRFRSINRRVLTVLLLAAVPILALGAWLVVRGGQSRVREAESVQLAQAAEYIASSTDAYVFRRIVDAAVIGRVIEIRRAAAEASRLPPDQKKIEALDAEWQEARRLPAALSGLLSNPASRFVTDVVKQYKGQRGQLMDQVARIYAQNFTADELQQYVNFYSSPAGQKLASTNFTINQELQRVMELFSMNLKTEFYEKVRADLKAKGVTL